MNKTPNFFIVGGPKCGTTAMVEYLRTHPNILISEPKEPNYFNFDMPLKRFVSSEKEYLNLFKKRTKSHKIVGDASVFSLISDSAIKAISEFNKDAQILFMMRDPIKMIPSYHKQIHFTLEEDRDDLVDALQLEETRLNGKEIPKHCRSEKLLFYSKVAKYGEQLEHIWKYFPKENVKLIWFDDFKNSPLNTYKEILAFLSLDYDGRVDFPKVNEAKKAKNKLISKIVHRPPWIAKQAAKLLRKVLNKPRLGMLQKIDHLNREKLEKKEISSQAKELIKQAYSEDVKHLSAITNRDLSHWLKMD